MVIVEHNIVRVEDNAGITEVALGKIKLVAVKTELGERIYELNAKSMLKQSPNR